MIPHTSIEQCTFTTHSRLDIHVGYSHSTPSPVARVTFLKTTANVKKAMSEFQTLWEKWDKGTEYTRNVILNVHN
jgi:hypothetical protein